MSPSAQLLKASALIQAFGGINSPGLAPQLSGSKPKFCLRAVAGAGAHDTRTSVPGHLHGGLHGSHVPEREAQEPAEGRWKEPSLRMDFTSLIPPSRLPGPPPRCCFRSPQGKTMPLRWWRLEKQPPLGKEPRKGLFLAYSSLTFTGGRTVLSAPHRNQGSRLSLGGDGGPRFKGSKAKGSN